MGIFENVEILGTSGADVEAELLHHQASHPATDAIHVSNVTGGEGFTQSSVPNDVEHPPLGGSISPDAGLSAEPEVPAPDADANPETQATDGDTKPPLEP